MKTWSERTPGERAAIERAILDAVRKADADMKRIEGSAPVLRKAA